MIVSDTSPLNYLVLIEAVDLLPKIYRRVIVPAAVMAELSRPQSPGPVRALAKNPPTWMEIASPQRTHSEIVGLGDGETSAIALALEIGDTPLLIDEQAGTVVARSLGLSTIGTVGVLLAGQEAGLSDSEQLFARLLTTTNFHLSPRRRLQFLDDLRKLKAL